MRGEVFEGRKRNSDGLLDASCKTVSGRNPKFLRNHKEEGRGIVTN